MATVSPHLVHREPFDTAQEAIAALTVFKICNPYIPFVQRLEKFLLEMLFPPLAAKVKFKAPALAGKKK